MNPSENDSDQYEEDLVRRVLEAAGPRHALPDDVRDRWESTFVRELDQVVRRRRRRRGAFAGLAESLAPPPTAIVILNGSSPPTQLVAETVLVQGESHLTDGERVTQGMMLAAGQTLETGPRGHVTMDYHGADVRIDADSTVKLHANRLELIEGALYVDTGADPSNATLPVLVETELGTLSHVGTQFLVSLHDSNLTAAVREGTMVLRTDGDDAPFTATGMAEVVRVSRSGEISTDQTTTHGEMWDWVVEASPGFTAAGNTQHDFLAWLARETGRVLVYENDDAREHARGHEIFGVRGQPIDRAISALNQASALRVELQDGPELRVALKS